MSQQQDMQAAPQPAWTIGRLIEWSTSYLKERGSASARLDSEVLLAQTLACTRIQLYTGWDKPLSAGEREPFRKALQRRASGEPVAYITGFKEFMGLTLSVSRAVLIPRPDTEVLVETALADARRRAAASLGASPEPPPLRVLDVGTGSGCIALALAKALPQASVEAWDVSEDALAQAEGNRARLGVANLELKRRDAMAPESWREAEAGGGFDLIVSNPPYIGFAEAASLPASVADYEPASALFAGDDGLQFHRLFAVSAGAALRAGGAMHLEIGASQADVVRALLIAAGWGEVGVTRDYGRNDRVVSALRP